MQMIMFFFPYISATIYLVYFYPFLLYLPFSPHCTHTQRREKKASPLM